MDIALCSNSVTIFWGDVVCEGEKDHGTEHFSPEFRLRDFRGVGLRRRSDPGVAPLSDCSVVDM